MRIFLTGATGYIGAAVLDALVRGGHDVTALVRNNEKARRVAKRAAHPVIGNLEDPQSFRGSVDAQDGYVHAAYDGRSGRGPSIDQTALEVLIAAAKRPRTAGNSGPDKRFIIYTSGVWILGRTSEPATEDAPINPIALSAFRQVHEKMVLDAGGDHLRTIVIRPGVVYGGGEGMIGEIFKSASNGLVRVVGDGNNHWPLIYDRDLADLYARLATHPDASGIYHANDEGDERVNDIVAAIKPYLQVKPDVRHVPIEEARHKMGAYADALALDQVVRSPRARALGWTPSLHSVAGNAARLLEEWRATRN
ncbi:MAG TPA: NAD-dependent epimerase/dehydratase family protein [Vicinamibacterales bacterium]|nr:NAD-dependent epimerase/dehydratase family protein [Vicinamibacterales bacterium]